MMNRGNDRTETLNGIMDREIEKNPHSRGLIDAFRPVIIERNRLLDEIAPVKIDFSTFDKIRFQGGVPLIRQQNLFPPDDPLKEMADRMVPAMKEGFPGLRDDLDRLQEAWKKGRLVLDDYFRAFPDHGDAVIDRWAADLHAKPQGFALMMHQLSRIVLEKRAQDAADRIKGIDWTKGFCPICGSFPSIALIEEKIPRRWLHCSRCGYDWLFSRVICPYCENEAQQGMDFFYVENRAQEAAFSCEKCKRYLITLNRVSDLHAHDLDVSAISLAHLDVIMQGKGFTPMTVCEWNSF
ncbi:MAG: formate dehydrogenase accessory protein FdhE [Deltaproteobacteria bacterium]|nr:formate dehydrogenase accessory protein FdhE [Deltaproteobacteria bacterium]